MRKRGKLTAIQNAILHEASKLRKFPETRYENWQRIIEAAENLTEARTWRRPIPLTEAEKRQQENAKRQHRRYGAELQKAADRLRAAGYSVKPPKTDEELDTNAEEWLEGYVKHG